MGIMTIVAYRPKPGKDEELLELTKQHVPALRTQGLASDRPAYAMRAADGTILEVFEWKSPEALQSAHANPAVQQMWREYSAVCDYVSLKDVKECGEMFAGFEPVEV